ncbi:MAG TPA: HlyD family efflux transporter periplasmic adaptor subunit [Candidatus Acidoferrales bacterium]|nr:HlyD family efflux transporter periplasmic adaptor subunit [Candidatus Acidoferrales bacterium]
MKRRIPLLLFIAAAVAAGLYFYPRFLQEPASEGALTVSGNIEAHESVLSFKVQGRIVELLVEEGQWVKEGTVIARLDAADFRQQVALEDASLRVREAELALALAGTRQQEIEAAQQTLIDAEADLKQKGLDFERAQTLYGKDVISEEARDQAETNLKRAKAIYERAKQRYDEALEGTRKEQIAVARANVQQARERLRLARVNLDYSVLEAPKAGVVVVRQVELGEVVAPGTPVVTLADLDNVWLRGYISETDLGRVRWGQPATLRTDTYPGKTYPGRVSFIAAKAEFTPKSIQTQKERVTLVYRIKVDVDNPNHELKPGMPADAVIDLKPR